MNLIDFSKATAAADQIEDHLTASVTKQILPVAESMLNEILDKAKGTLEETVGGTLSALTGERQELVNDLHGFLDRLNGTEVVMTLNGLKLRIPPRVEAVADAATVQVTA